MPRIKHPCQLPGFRELERRASVIRTIAFQDIPERIGDFTVLPLTLRHYGILRIMGSPFLRPFYTPTAEEIGKFLWVLHPQFTPEDSRAKRQHFRRCRAFELPPLPWFTTGSALARWQRRRQAALEKQAVLVKAGREFMDEAMIDRPPGGSGRRETEYYCDEVSIVGTLAREYGWGEADILRIPLKRIFQYLKESHEHFSWTVLKRKPVLWNPTDAMAEAHLIEINRNRKN